MHALHSLALGAFGHSSPYPWSRPSIAEIGAPARTQARHSLRNFLEGVSWPSAGQVLEACRVLEKYHSGSTLEGKARRRLQAYEHLDDMPAQKRLQGSCGGCGKHWQSVQQREKGKQTPPQRVLPHNQLP